MVKAEGVGSGEWGDCFCVTMYIVRGRGEGGAWKTNRPTGNRSKLATGKVLCVFLNA